MDGLKPIVRGPAQGQILGVAGHRYRILAGRADTNEEYTLIEGVLPPGDGPPPHEHLEEDEAFYVLDGNVVFTIEGKEVAAPAGTYALIPKGTIHSFRNPGPGDARIIFHVSPAGIEEFFLEVGIPMHADDEEPPPTSVEHLEKIVAAAGRYGMRIHP